MRHRPVAARRPRQSLTRWQIALIAFATAVATFALLQALPAPAQRLEGVLSDLRHSTWMALRGPRDTDPPSPVTVIDLDERTLEALGPYGESYRAAHARLLATLTRHGAGVVAFDILFKAPAAPLDLDRTRHLLREAGIATGPDSTWARVRRDMDVSRDLETAARRSPAVFASQLTDTLDYPNRSDWAPKASRTWQRAVWEGLPLEANPRLANLPGRGALDGIYPDLAQAAPRLGLTNLEPDPDGTVRRLQLLWRFPEGNSPDSSLARPAAYPVLALQAALTLLGKPSDAMTWDGRVLDLGAPVRIWRTAQGRLATSVPGLTEAMCAQLRARRDVLDTLESAQAGIRTLTEPTIQAPGTDTTNSVIPDPADRLLWTQVWWDRTHRRLATSLAALRGGVLRDLANLSPARLDSLKIGDTLDLGERIRIPTSDRGAMLLPFASATRGEGRRLDQAWIRHVSFVDVLEGRFDPAQIAGRAFLVGSSASALADFVEAPIEQRHPGVDVLALGISSIVGGDFLQAPPVWMEFALGIPLVLVACLCTAFMNPAPALAAVAALLVAWFAAALAAFDAGWWLQILPSAVCATTASVAILGARTARERRRRLFLHASFKTYLSPELIDRMLREGTLPRLGGETREITAFFSDIQGFSTFSERIGSPDRLVELVNEYLSEMTRILLETGGTLDKYVGDAIVAMYGAPAALDDHARRAVEGAVRMQERLAELRAKWHDEGDKWPDIVHHMRMRIGLNSGPIVTGNMGSELRMNYTMMGDDVNLAARLESVSKQYGVFVLASEATLRAAGPGYVTREIDRLRVVGKTEPVVVHEILGRAEGAPHSLTACAEAFGKARSLYVAGEFRKALEAFDACRELEPWVGEDGVKNCPSEVFAARCRSFLEHPPLAWDAVHTATEK